MSTNLAQLRRIIMRQPVKNPAAGEAPYKVLVFEPDDLGQDTQATFNFSPRKMTRSSQLGTTETPIPGTFDSLTATITFLADNWSKFGKALRNWNPATFSGATDANGNIIIGGDTDFCAANEYVDVIIQGVCDDGSSTEVEFTRCLPSLDSDVELSGSDALEVELALNPVAYNPTTHKSDGFPEYTIRMGDYDLATKMRLNVTTGEYIPATPGTGPTEPTASSENA